MPTPQKKPQPFANPFTMGAGQSQVPAFAFGAGMGGPQATTGAVAEDMPQGPMAAQPQDPFAMLVQQFLAQMQGGQQQPNGPDVGGLIKQLREPRPSQDLTNAYNIGSGLPSGAGSPFNPFNNPAMFGSADPSGAPRKRLANPFAAGVAGAASGAGGGRRAAGY